MHILSIGMDRNVCVPGSAVHKRFSILGDAHPEDTFSIIVFSTRAHALPDFYTIGENVRVYPTNVRSRWLYGMGALRIARRLQDIDIVDAQDPFETGHVGRTVSLERSIPLHVQIHTDFLSPAFARHTLLNRLRVWGAGKVLRSAARVLVVSNRIKESVLAAYTLTAPITVLPLYTEIKQASPEEVNRLRERFAAFTNVLLVVARFEPEKNISLVLQAVSKLPSDTCLVLVGEGSERVSLEARAAHPDLAGRVFFEGWQDPSPYYAVASLLLAPSSYEGYSLTLVEALTSGIPVLSTDVGAAREVGALVVSEKQFSSALQEWVSNGPKRGVFTGVRYSNMEEYLSAFYKDIRACI